jgi:LysM repeat protein
MLKRILFLFLILSSFSVDSFAQVKDLPKVNLSEKEYFKYKVKSKETIYSLCRRFNVTEAELLSMNPSIVEGLKSGQTLLIPIKKDSFDTDDSNKDTVKDTTEIVTDEADIATTKRKSTIYISSDRPRITVLLPFAPNALPGSNERYVEFYEGLLLAVDSLKSRGLSFEVQALESGYDTENITKLINSGQLAETDYCIGGVTSEQISLLAEWAYKNQRYMIFPFNSRIPEMDDNPYLFQTNTPHNQIYESLAEYASKRADGTNIIFLNTGTDASDQRAQLIPKVKKELKSLGIPYLDVADDEKLEALSKALSTTKLNQIMPSPLSLQETNNLLTRLGAFHKVNPDIAMALVGYPDWIAVGKTYQRYLHDLNTVIYSNFYADATQKNVRDFQILFNQTYAKNMLNTYPKYGMMGYDIATYFIPRMVFEKSEVLETFPTIEALQSEFKFSTTGPLSGASNQCVYIIHFTPENEVQVKVIH